MLSTLSPGGTMQWMSPDDKKSIDVDMISNPFIEKSDIVNHKKKIADIDRRKEMI